MSRVARQQQASAFEAVEHGGLPRPSSSPWTLGLDSGDPVLALEALDLLAPIHGRAVGMPFADQAVYEALELFGSVLEDDAVRLHGLQRRTSRPSRSRARADSSVGQQLGHVDVVPVHPARGVQEQLWCWHGSRSRNGGCWCAWCRWEEKRRKKLGCSACASSSSVGSMQLLMIAGCPVKLRLAAHAVTAVKRSFVKTNDAKLVIACPN